MMLPDVRANITAKNIRIICRTIWQGPAQATHPQSDMPFLVTLALAGLEVWTPTDFGSKT